MSEPEVLWQGHELAAGPRRRLVKYADSARATWETRGIDSWKPDNSRMKATASADEMMLARRLRALEAAAQRALDGSWEDMRHDQPTGHRVIDGDDAAALTALLPANAKGGG